MLKTILVTGATGRQGSAVVAALSALPNSEDFTILAMSRDPKAAKSQALLGRHPSIQLVAGDFANLAPVFTAAPSPIWGVYSIQNPHVGAGASLESEVSRGKSLIDASIKNNVQHFVYSSVDRGDENDTDVAVVPHYETKRQIENYLREKTASTQMKYTILRPVFFMENISNDILGRLLASAWKYNIDPKPLQLVATGDIGYFAARAFANPHENAGRVISLAGDEMTHAEASEIWRAETGSAMPLSYWVLEWMLMKAMKDVETMFAWFGGSGFKADITLCKKENPDMLDFRTWVKRNRSSH